MPRDVAVGIAAGLAGLAFFAFDQSGAGAGAWAAQCVHAVLDLSPMTIEIELGRAVIQIEVRP